MRKEGKKYKHVYRISLKKKNCAVKYNLNYIFFLYLESEINFLIEGGEKIVELCKRGWFSG